MKWQKFKEIRQLSPNGAQQPLYMLFEEFNQYFGHTKAGMQERQTRLKVEKEALDTKPDPLMTIQDYRRQLELTPNHLCKPMKKCTVCGTKFTPSNIGHRYCDSCQEQRLQDWNWENEIPQPFNADDLAPII
jgi:hypothetical protein